MRFTRQNKILLLVLLIILNVVIRIPLVPHELGADSFYIHQYADSITNYGEIMWIGHPVQFFGFGTAPPAFQILISGLSQCLGISSELSILILSFISGLSGAIMAYIFIYYVTKDDHISFLTAFLFSLSAEFLRLTIWTATTRSLFVALVPLFLYLLFKTIITKRKLSYILLLFSIYALLMATHHMGVLLLFYLFPLFILFLFKMLEKLKFIELINARIVTLLWIPLFLLLFLPVVLKLGFFKDQAFLWNNYLSGRFFEGDGLHVVPLNLVLDYAGKMGFLLPFVIIGVIWLLFKTGKRTIFESYVLVFLLLVAPILAVGTYTPMFVLIIFAFLIAKGLIRFMDINIAKKRVKILLPVFLVVTLCFSIFILALWGGVIGGTTVGEYQEHTKNTGFFLKNYGVDGSFTSNDRTYIYRHSVYSGMLNAPSNLYKQCYMEWKIKARLNRDIISIFKGHGENIILFEKERDENVKDPWHDYGFVWRNDPDGDRNRLDYYNINYCIQINFGGYSVKRLGLFTKMQESRPKIYDNKMEDIYFIG